MKYGRGYHAAPLYGSKGKRAIVKITAEITPIPLGRPRLNTTNRGRYLPKSNVEFREKLQWILRSAFPGKPFENPLSVTLHFYKPTKTTAKNYGDVDNLAKAVLDAGNGILWLDDSQIVELHGYKHKGEGKIEMEAVVNVD